MNDELNVLKIVATRLHQVDIPYMVTKLFFKKEKFDQKK
jgi:hypothetical protein